MTQDMKLQYESTGDTEVYALIEYYAPFDGEQKIIIHKGSKIVIDAKVLDLPIVSCLPIEKEAFEKRLNIEAPQNLYAGFTLLIEQKTFRNNFKFNKEII